VWGFTHRGEEHVHTVFRDLDGRDHLADRLSDEVDWLRQCAGWLRQLDGGG
jgi:hypothetical protein